MEQRRENYEIQKNALELATRRVTSTTLLLEAGRAEVRDLVDAQDAQISAQNAVTTALVDYQESRLQLLLDIGALHTAEPQFWLKENLRELRAGNGIARFNPQGGEQEVKPPEHYFEN